LAGRITQVIGVGGKETWVLGGRKERVLRKGWFPIGFNFTREGGLRGLIMALG